MNLLPSPFTSNLEKLEPQPLSGKLLNECLKRHNTQNTTPETQNKALCFILFLNMNAAKRSRR